MKWITSEEYKSITLSNAKRAIDTLNGIEKDWFTKLLSILENKQYARVHFNKPYPKHPYNIIKNDCIIVDVEAIANTHNYASFFDLINHRNYIDFSFEPIAIKKCEYRLV